MNGGRGIEKGCLLVFFVKGARTAIVNALTVLETQNLEPNRTILFSPETAVPMVDMAMLTIKHIKRLFISHVLEKVNSDFFRIIHHKPYYGLV